VAETIPADQLTQRVTNIVAKLHKFSATTQFESAGLLSGELGNALFITTSQLSSAGSEDLSDKLFSSLDKSLTGFESDNAGALYSLSDGLPGLAIVLNVLRAHQFLDDNSEATLAEIEQHLSKVVEDDSFALYQKSGFDYFYGLTGIGIAFASFSESPLAEKTINTICRTILAHCESNSSGITWRDSKLFGRQPYNLGIAHGVVSILVLFSKAVSQYKLTEFEQPLIEATNWYLRQENHPNILSRFSCSIGADGEDQHTMNRLAWCYGDLPSAIALIHVYEATGISRYLHKAKEIIGGTLVRTDVNLEIDNVDGRVYDSGLCHGLASLVLCYRSIADYFGEEEYYDIYRFWLQFIMEQVSISSDKVACFKITREPQGNKFQESYSFLEGACGVGLLLNAAVDNSSLEILSRIFMTDISKSRPVTST
jgi:lantibiotic biosynthesis protein